MTRTSTKSNQAATAASPAKAAASSPTQSKFGKAFSKTYTSSPTKGKTTTVDVDYEILTPLGTCLVTFSQHNKSKSAYVHPLLKNLEENAEQIYETCRIFSQAALFDPDTPDRKQKKTPGGTLNVNGLVITFNFSKDHITETNVLINVRKAVQALVTYANIIAHRPWNDNAAETFTYKSEFCQGTDYTRTGASRRHLGQVISPEDSVYYMERMFDGDMTFEEITQDPDIMAGMYGTLERGNALVTIGKPGFTPHEKEDPEHPKKDNQEGDLPVFVAEP
jgi:hypothetical protein